MPLISQDEVFDSVQPLNQDLNESLLEQDAQQEAQEEHNVPFGQTFGAAFRQENLIGSAINAVQNNVFTSLYPGLREIQPDFDPFANIQGYEESASDFAYANSDEEVESIKAFIDKQREDRQILADSGVAGVLSMVGAGIVDPTILVPAVGAITKATKAGRVAQAALQGSALTAGAVGAQEAGLQATQTERTAAESAIAIASGAILGGAVGAGIGALSKGSKEAIKNYVSKTIKGEDVTSDIKLDIDANGNRSASAAERTDLGDEGLARINKHAVELVSGGKIKGLMSVVARTVTSDSLTLQSIGNRIFEHSFLLGKNLKGQASPDAILTQLEKSRARSVRLGVDLRDSFAQFKKNNPDQTLNINEFGAEVAKAMRRADDHAIPEVRAMAHKYRTELDKITKELQGIGVLDDVLDVRTAKSYLSRWWDAEALIADRGKLERLRTKVRRFIAKENPNFDEAQVVTKSDEIIDNILSQGDEALSMSDIAANKIASKSAKFTKERAFLIPDEEVEEFLVNDAQAIIQNYIMRGNSILELDKMLKGLGFDSLQDARKAIRDEFEDMIKKNPSKSKKLHKQMNEAIDLLNFSANAALGRVTTSGNKAIDESLRTLRGLNSFRLLGGVVISSLGDPLIANLRLGLPSVVWDGYGSFLRGFKAARQSTEELKDLGIGLELEANRVLKSMVDPDFNLNTSNSPVQKILNTSTNAFGRISGLSYWNHFHTTMMGHVAKAQIIRRAKKMATGKLSKRETEIMLTSGIDEATAAKIVDQFKKYGQEIDGSFIANFHKWQDEDARRLFENAIIKEVNNVVLRPGPGDLPVVAQTTELGKTIFQYKSFPATATNRILIPSMQRRDYQVASTIAMLTFMGGMIQIIKNKQNGKDTPLDTEEDIAKLTVDGISRSGVAGLMMGDVALGLLGGSSKFSGINFLSILTGPTTGLIQDVGTAGLAPKDGEIEEHELKAMRRLMPLQNVFYLRKIFDEMFEDD